MKHIASVSFGKDSLAIERIKWAHSIAAQRGETLICAYSGGKDSDVLLDLTLRAGVPCKVVHNHTTADAPETVYYIRDKFHSLTAQGIACEIRRPPPGVTMWSLIPRKRMPPTQLARYCCSELKERSFDGEHVMTGVRRAESNKRSGRGLVESLAATKKDKKIYFDENDEARKLTEICQIAKRVVTNPIIDWTDADVWGYIRMNGLTVNPLYAQGYTRVGCVGCPMAGRRQKAEFNRYPKYKQMYLHAFGRMIERNKADRPDLSGWESAQEVFDWWMRDDPNQTHIDFDCEEEQT